MAGTDAFAPRVALIHATALAVAPIQAAFAQHWPGARRMNLLDDSLSVDLACDGELTPAMVQRFVELAQYAVRAGCGGILFTCSAFGPAIEAAARASGVPTLKPNQAMFEAALAIPPRGQRLRLGLVATFEASIPSMRAELEAMAREAATAIEVRSVFVPRAMDDLAQGRADEHHRQIAAAARSVADCDAVMLAQFSMAAAAPAVQAVLSCPVLTSPDCAVLALQRRMCDE
jgi:Asp/Glu/hydantoin racemase